MVKNADSEAIKAKEVNAIFCKDIMEKVFIYNKY